VSDDPSSRHRDLPTYSVVLVPGSAPVELYQPRTIPLPPASVTHTVRAGDRLDLLAYRYFGDPFQFWRIADANPALAPEDVLDPGAQISIPAKK
jgi:nucleoid-associated protein YgaU